ncbi:MAG: response regulator transcription factor, partial [Cyclobacteriaceae bacterium]
MKKTKLILVEDHELVRKGISSILQMDSSLEILGEYDRPRLAFEALKSGINPDIIIMDISMPEMNGLEASKILEVEYPAIKVIILSMHKEEEYVLESLNYNVCGYVVKDSVADEIIVAIEKVVSGGKFFSKVVIDTALNSYKG